MHSRRRTEAAAVALLAATSLSCGNDRDPMGASVGDSESLGGITLSAGPETDGKASAGGTLGTTTGPSGETQGAATAAGESENPSGPTVGSSQPKFDVGGFPDVDAGCNGTGPIGGITTYSFIWIANTAQGTVSKINTRTGVEEGRYHTSDPGDCVYEVGEDPCGDSPSRTSVNQFGDVAVGNRSGTFGVTKIAAIRERCRDANGDGEIQTSSGADDILPFGEDECVLWHVEMPRDGESMTAENSISTGSGGDGPRAIAWEGGSVDPITCENTNPDPRLWIGWGEEHRWVYRLDGSTGDFLDTVELGPAEGSASFKKVYGGAVNARGDLWLVTRGSRELTFVDGETLEFEHWPLPENPYGMGVDQDGHPWFVTMDGSEGYGYHFDPTTEELSLAGSVPGRMRGMNFDREGRLWAARNVDCALAVFEAATETLIADDIELPGCSEPVGVSIDDEGFVWVVDRNGGAYKLDPESHEVVLEVEGLFDPYTYSDMTGSGLNLVLNPPG